MEIFYALCGIAVLVIAIVIFLMIKDEKESGETVQKLNADKLPNFFSDSPVEIDLAEPTAEPSKTKPAKKSIIAGMLNKIKPTGKTKGKKKSKTPDADPFAAQMPPSGKPKKKESLLSKLKFGKSKTVVAAAATTAAVGSNKESKSLIGKLLNKVKRGKKKDDLLDIPQPTPFPNLQETGKKDSSEDTNQSIPLVKPVEDFESPDEGTASLRMDGSEIPADEPIDPLITIGDEKKIETEIEAQMQLSELKEKYEKLEQLFRDKSDELEKTDHTLQTEIHNRKEFNKVKDILEKELKDVKDRAKVMQNELSAATTQDNEHKENVSSLEEQATNLEKIVQEKEEEIERLVTEAEAKEKTVSEEPSITEDKTTTSEPEVKPTPETESTPEPEPDVKPESIPEPKEKSAITLEPTPLESEDVAPADIPLPPEPIPEPQQISSEEKPQEKSPGTEETTPASEEAKIEAITPEEAKKAYDPSDIEKELGIGEIAQQQPTTKEIPQEPIENKEKTEAPEEKDKEIELTPIDPLAEIEPDTPPEVENDFLSLQPDIADKPPASEKKEDKPTKENESSSDDEQEKKE